MKNKSIKDLNVKIDKIITLNPKSNLPAIKMVSMREVSEMAFDEPEFIVNGLVPIGVTVLGGKAKSGKSVFLLDLAKSVAKGTLFLKKYACEKVNIILLPLEDSLQRINKRISNTKSSIFIPKNVFIPKNPHEFPTVKQNGIQVIEKLVKETSSRLVIIDTLSIFFTGSKFGGLNYQDDYAALAQLHKLALKLRIAILLVHHTTKMNYQDPFDSLQGSVGIIASPDCLMVLIRTGNDAVLHVRGRDIADQTIPLKFLNKSIRWKLDGSYIESKLGTESQKVLNVFKQKKDKTFSLNEVSNEIGDNNVQNTKSKIMRLQKRNLVQRVARGQYKLNTDIYRD